MPHAAPIGLFCQFRAAGFSGERIVLLNLPGGVIRRGLAPLHYCWKRDGSPLGADEPSNGDVIEGIVAARLLDSRGADELVVTTPDGEVFSVPRSFVTPRPKSEMPTNVSI